MANNNTNIMGRNSGNGEKAKDFKGTWIKMIKYSKRYVPLAVISICCAMGGAICSLLGPNKLSDLTNLILEGITTGIDFKGVRNICLLLVAFYVSSYLLHVIQSIIMANYSQGVSKSLRSDISKKINRLPMWFYNRTSTGDILSCVTNDIDTIAQSMNQSIGTLVTSSSLFIGSLIMMFVTNPIMALAAVAASILGFVFIFLVMGRSQKYFALQQKHLGEVNGHVEEVYTGHTIVKVYNGEAQEKKEFLKMNNALRNSAFRAQCLSGLMMPFMTFIGNLGYVAVCIVGAVLVQKGKIDFGVIVAFMVYVRQFTQPLSQIAQSMQSLQSAAAASERAFEFIEAEEMDDESGKKKQFSAPAKGNVEFEHVKFGYEGTNKIIINDFSAKAKAGQKIAIVGPTGAGKTTIVNLLMRFNEINGGKIYIDGIPTCDMTRAELRNQFCMVLQDTWLFEGTVRENLVYNMENVPEEKIEKACKAVGLDHFVRTLLDGYDTVLSDNVNLSAGQKQQLTIARAMIADKPILILDEATSSIDTRTELKIQQAMDELMKGRTSFVIAHRLSTIKNADLILVLKDGNVIESGTHEELMKKKGFYEKLYNSQFDQTDESA
ncbi:MAG: ABC transporter ATP-binding protein/permease [Clostridiales bacterium]|nr:ABC transporter ATP-binding protein/permease [Clostridiales bacterium]